MEEFDETLSERPKGRKGPRVNNEDAPASIFLDPWLTAKGAPLVALVDHLMSITMPDTTGRTRSLRRDAAERRRFVMGNIAANLVHLALSPSHEAGNLLGVATAKTKATRYDRADYPQRMLAGAVEALEQAGMLVIHPYVFKQRTTTVEPTVQYIAMIHRHGVRPVDIGRTGRTDAATRRLESTSWPMPTPRRPFGYVPRSSGSTRSSTPPRLPLRGNPWAR